MYRDLDESNKSQLRERVDMSMRSPTNNWINESLQKIAGNKKSVSSERKNQAAPGQGEHAAGKHQQPPEFLHLLGTILDERAP